MKRALPVVVLSIIVVLQLLINIILGMLIFSDRERNEMVSYTTKNELYSLSFIEIGNPWAFGDNEVEVHAIKHGLDQDNDQFYFGITFHNTNDWSALPTLRFEETTDGVNFYVTQGEREGETKYVVLWANVFPVKW